MTSSEAMAQQRRAQARADLDRLGVPYVFMAGMWSIETRDGETHDHLAISHVEWYVKGLDDGAEAGYEIARSEAMQ